METRETKVVMKEWSNPTAAGLVALAVACSCFFALLTGRIGTEAMPLMGCWLLGGFVVQLIVAILDLKGGNATGGNTFLFFSAFFMLVGGMEMLLKYEGVMAGTPLDGRIDGFSWAMLTLALLLWTPAFLTKFSLLSVVVLLLDVALPFITLMDLGVIGKQWGQVPAWALLLAGLTALYLSATIIVNGAFKRKVYPAP